jgi:hypothetical protein
MILGSARDLASYFLYYDRREDEDLPEGQIEEDVKDGVVTVDEIVAAFRAGLVEDGHLGIAGELGRVAE